MTDIISNKTPWQIKIIAVITALQLGRLGAVQFFQLASKGELSLLFALPAGIGDIFIGITAPVAIFLLLNKERRNSRARKLLVGWNILGILDLAMAVGLGIITDFPMEARIKTFLVIDSPLSIVPMIAVPLCVIFHAISAYFLSTEKIKKYFT